MSPMSSKRNKSASRSRVNSTLPAPRNAIDVMAHIGARSARLRKVRNEIVRFARLAGSDQSAGEVAQLAAEAVESRSCQPSRRCGHRDRGDGRPAAEHNWHRDAMHTLFVLAEIDGISAGSCLSQPARQL